MVGLLKPLINVGMVAPVAAVVVVALLAGCATKTTSPSPAPKQPLAQPTAPIDNTTSVPQPALAGVLPPPLRGRIAARIQRGSLKPPEGGTTQFELNGDEQQGSLQLISPLGIRMAQAHWGPNGIELSTLREKRQFSHMDELSQLWFKQHLPMAAFFTWLRGQPWPQASHQRTEQGFEQLGWRISNQLYAQGKLELHRPPQAEDETPTEIWLRAQLDVQP